MRDGIMLTVAEDGTARVYDDTYDIVIHCESQEEHDKAMAMLRGMEPKTTPSAQEEKWISEIREAYARALANPYIRKPLSRALYEVWHRYDVSEVERR